jgi:WhiB family redox-sensing transcriptional regulator
MMRDLPPRPEVLEMLTMILEARNERSWRHLAACKGMDPNLFFPTRGGNNTLRAAKAVCASCPVSTQCAEAGKDERTGTWGGISSFKRQRSNVPQKSFAKQYKEWIINTEPSDEVAAYDLGIQVGSVQRSRLRTQQAKEGTT